jgi:hypothetical protein
MNMRLASFVPKFVVTLAAGAAFAALPLAAQTAPPKASSEVTVTGEVLDMACYLDHGAHGEKHAGCAEKCISSGLPVGLKGTDGKTYLLIGEHMPANDVLAKLAAQTITVKGKLVSRDGINLLENIEIVKS